MSPLALAGRSALLTGAASGIGKAMTNRLLLNGVKTLLAVDINEATLHPSCEALQKAYPSSTILPILCDVNDPAALRAAFETPSLAAPLSIIVNNAGTAIEGSNWRLSVNLNLLAAIEGTTLALEQFMKHKNPGVVINVASVAGLYPAPLTPVYTAGKHGLVGYSRCFDHLQKKGIRVNCLCPAFVDTPLVQGMLQSTDARTAAIGKMAVDNMGGCIPMEEIELAFLKLIVDEKIAGGVMKVTNKGGAELQQFPVMGEIALS